MGVSDSSMLKNSMIRLDGSSLVSIWTKRSCGKEYKKGARRERIRSAKVLYKKIESRSDEGILPHLPSPPPSPH